MFCQKPSLLHRLVILTFLISINASVRTSLLVYEAFCGKLDEGCVGVKY